MHPSGSGVPPPQTPAVHTSPLVHGLPSVHVVPSVTFGCVHAPAPLHSSRVHWFVSGVQRVPARSKQSSSVSLQSSAHSEPPVHGSPLWRHAPPAQVSVPLQKRPSSQD